MNTFGFTTTEESYDMNQIRQMFLDNMDMPLDDFITYMNERGVYEPLSIVYYPELFETFRLYFTDVDLLRKYLRDCFALKLTVQNVVVKRKGDPNSYVSATEMYGITRFSGTMRDILDQLGYVSVYCTMYGWLELFDIDSDVEKVIKMYDNAEVVPVTDAHVLRLYKNRL